VLENSIADSVPVDIDTYIMSVPSSKHSLFLIPHGTVHGSGKNNLVLEISATTYIYTFKMYDWLRPDLDGQPRRLNIKRAFDNLYFNRKGNTVKEDLISCPYVKKQGSDWRLIHLPTHLQHFYDIHRFDFKKYIEATTDGSFHIMMLVEGSSVILETAAGIRKRFNYAETFVVPASASKYRLINESKGEAKVIKAFIK
jgi:mannose-6-phosphate isomerase class I